MVAPSKISALSLPPLVMRNSFGIGHAGRVALKAGHRAGREDQDAVRRLSAQDLLPGEGHHIELGPIQRLREAGGGGVADGDPFPVGGDEVAVRHAHARGGAVPGEDQIGVGAHLAQVRQLAVRARPAPRRRASAASPHRSPSPCRSSRRPGAAPGAGPASTTWPSPPRRCPSPARCRSDSRPEPPAPRGCGRWRPEGAPCPILERCERPRTALERFSGFHPGCLAHGPEEKSGHAGFMAGFWACRVAG